MFGEASGLTGANLVKGNTPYPIFLPYVVRSLMMPTGSTPDPND